MELGPCKPTVGGENTTTNEFSWTNNANVIFLDQVCSTPVFFCLTLSSTPTHVASQRRVFVQRRKRSHQFRRCSSRRLGLSPDFHPNVSQILGSSIHSYWWELCRTLHSSHRQRDFQFKWTCCFQSSRVWCCSSEYGFHCYRKRLDWSFNPIRILSRYGTIFFLFF